MLFSFMIYYCISIIDRKEENMKKKILFIVFIIFIGCLFLVINSLTSKNNVNNNKQTDSYEVINENANEDNKKLLNLQYWEDVNIDIPEIEYKEAIK